MTATTPTTPTNIGRRTERRSRNRRSSLYAVVSPGSIATLEHAAVALLAFVPLLLIRPGVVTSDTKTYLYLDPGRFLHQIVSMWDPDVALGTVTHQSIGYLFPMGPFFLVLSELHVPLWIAQRLWLGAVLFAAGAGILYLCRTIDLDGPGRLVAAMAFMLSPYLLQYAGRISVILLPWAGLPWMVAFTARALRKGGWRYPALFGVVMALVSAINATAVLYVGVAPFLWLLYAVGVAKEARWRDAIRTALKIIALSLIVSVWWIAGLQVEAAYGVNVLKFTETVPSTSETSTASEVLRGLGYWYFYGGDRDGPWTFASVLYTQNLWVLALSFFLPVLSFASAVLVRWRARAYMIALIVVGVVLSVGAHPYYHPTAAGGVLKAFMTETTAGLALRSTDRATPLVVLGTAMLLGAGATALWHRFHWAGALTALVLVGLVVANNSAIFDGDFIANNFTQPAHLPAYEQQAANHLNAIHPGTRVVAIPGNDFAVSRWGDTVDTPQPALLTRPFAIHEQQIMGSMATADMLYAFDEPIQLGTANSNAIAPMARLLSAGDLLVENDTAYEHYGIPQPELLNQVLTPTPSGLSDPVSYGTPVPNVSKFSTLDEADLATNPNPSPLEPMVSYTVDNTRPISRAESDQGALVVAGDAEGLGDMAGTGLLNTKSAIYYSGTLDTDPGRLRSLMRKGAALVVTDTNRKQAFRWDALTANTGYTETPSQNLTRSDQADFPLQLFPGAPMSAKSTAYDVGAVSVTASSYGDQVSYLPENRAYSAVDGNPDTAWETGSFVSNPSGQWWQIHLQHPVTTNQVTLVQPLNGNRTRWITGATLTFDGKHPTTVHLGPSSRRSTGQAVTFPSRTFSTLRVKIDRTSDDHAPTTTAGPVGFSSVTIPGVQVTEVVKMPQDLLDKAGTASLGNRLTMVMTRQRVSPFPVRTDPETTISREFTLPTARTFTLSGSASISALIPDSMIDQLVGRPGSDGSGVVAFSSGRLPGSLTSSAAAAADGNPATVWQPGFGAAAQQGAWLQYNLPAPISFDHMNLQVVADGRHSVPTSVRVSTENGSRTVHLPPIADSATPGAVTTIPISFPSLSGSQIRVSFPTVRVENTENYYSPSPLAMPLGIAEVGIPGLDMPADPTTLPGTCQSNLITIDGQPVSVRVVGSTNTALADGEVSVIPCGADANGITLGAGAHVIQTAVGHQAGWNVDQLVLDSAAGGGPAPVALSATPPSSSVSTVSTLPAVQPGPAPTVRVTHQNATSLDYSVHGATQPFTLVLGESQNAGWKAVATPGPSAPTGARAVDLGRSQLVDGFANGWHVSAAELKALGGAFTVALTWTPQTRIWAALAVSVVGLVLCLVLGYLPERWRAGWRARWRRLLRRGDPPPVAAQDVHGAPGPGARLRAPWHAGGHRPPWWAVAIVAVVSGAVAAAITAPVVGLAVAVATAAALVVPWARVVLVGAAVGLVMASAAAVVGGQVAHALPESSNWPSAYENAGTLAWMAVVFLGADAVVEMVRRLARPRPEPSRRPDGPAGPDGTGGTARPAPPASSEPLPPTSAATPAPAPLGPGVPAAPDPPTP